MKKEDRERQLQGSRRKQSRWEEQEVGGGEVYSPCKGPVERERKHKSPMWREQRREDGLVGDETGRSAVWQVLGWRKVGELHAGTWYWLN